MINEKIMADTKAISPELMKEILNNQIMRTDLTQRNHWWFFNVYLNHYVKLPSAPFHQHIFSLTEDETIKTLLVVAFRGSSKSTILTLSFPIWAILGKQQKKFVVILGQTQRQARQQLINIRYELESNELLRQDLGPFKEIEDEWGSYSLVIPKYGARITAASMEQTIRGMRHNQYRPDLIICDDIEDLTTVKTKDGRDKIHQWITGEVIPAGDLNTRVIFVGNMLHEDSLLMRVKEKIINKDMDGYFMQIPLVDANDNITWPGKYPTFADIEKQKRDTGNEISWQREYMLKIVPDSERVVFEEWLERYDNLPPTGDGSKYRYVATGVDLAISQKDNADYTAMVSARVYGYGEDIKIYIFPNPVNERLTFPQQVERAKAVSLAVNNGRQSKLIIEDVQYQLALVQQLKQGGFPAVGAKVSGDKRARLALTTHLIQSGKIVFPRKGAETLIRQLVDFGVEKHDDLADAFTILIQDIMANNKRPPICEIFFV
ncbi:MAG: phage terminase large subunit [Patescibacteria group bacterium]|nr:phage terminase large subunit [Patescibacteria group bacterium]